MAAQPAPRRDSLPIVRPTDRIAVILNRTAGTAADSVVGTISEVLRDRGADVLVEPVAGTGLQEAAARAVADGYGIVAAAGGDGTVNTVASAVRGTGATLGILPLGTLNHFAKDVGIPLDLERAADTLVTGRTLRVDAGEVNGRLFLNNSSLGTYPSLVLAREQQRRGGGHKWLAHALAAVQVWRRYRRMRVEFDVDGERRRVLTPFVFIGNNDYTLEGTKIGRRERLDGGHLQLCMAPGMTRRDMIHGLLAALGGRLDSVERFEVMRERDFAVHTLRGRLLVSLDGELTVLASPLRYRSCPGELSVRVPCARDTEDTTR